MTDAELIESWKKITDPYEALEELLTYNHYIGSDPYYRDLNNALWDMASRVLSNPRSGGNES